MIARIWHAWTKRTDAKTYENMLRDKILPSIAARNVNGYRGAQLSIREDENESEFITLLLFESMDAVKEFAGAYDTKPVIFPGVDKLLTRMDPARYYRIAISSRAHSRAPVPNMIV